MPDDKNPLDALEELLADAPSTKSIKPKKKTKEELEAELAVRREAFEKKEGEQKILDAEQLIKQKQAILSIKGTKEYQARVQQDKEKVEENKKQASASEGFEVTQIKHTKI